jgi:hypothetical protein
MNWLVSTPQFKQGMKVEDYLDAYFTNRGFTVIRTTARQERELCLGDRIFIKDGKPLLVEYKSGIQTFYTGNIFLETVSVDSQNKPGWVYTSQADYVFYAALLNNKILVFRPAWLRGQIEELKLKFKEVSTSHNQNRGYNTHGVIVPLEYAESHLAEKVLEAK